MAITVRFFFKNDDDAIEFVQSWDKALVDSSTMPDLTSHAMMVSAHKIPTLFCDQQTPFPHTRSGWVQRPTRGWWVCPICKRPTKYNWAQFSQDEYSSVNILEAVRNAAKGDRL